ncbi:MAG: cupin domain-containing protein [Rhodospirillaceae bacterium]|nr:cupin domain-containing protein [Rhodospirillaceae bacterium]MBT3490873.1 cupin domain-containing protein [Rhodospirillaceae bacterium]MBT3976633.1 cupin domain-containing protein [Rhodospirillaceae bacterium]MBT4169962.1 cupin domain-containing protein [Rhodospirillaceae bacterium]MBT4562451.1 cupin domain-containing protein [Rhodospirillaceae bacterium]
MIIALQHHDGMEADVEVRPYEAAKIAGREPVMEGADMRVTVLTLAEAECIPWHYHNEITDSFVCLEGPMVVETRAPRAEYVLRPGERCEVPPKVAHYVHGLDNGAFKFLIIQGVGVYDNIPVARGSDRGA